MVVRQLIALPSQLQLIDRLQHHIYLTSSLIFVSGEKGGGKSTLLEKLSNKLPGTVQEAFIALNDQLSDAQIRQQIIVQLYEAPLFDAQDSLFSSIALLQEKQGSDTPRLIIVDNAHHLSPQLLAELAELIAQKERLGESEVNVLLLSDDENSLQMLTSVSQRCACLEFKLEALTRDEANSLLEHIFRQAGYQHQIQHQNALVKQLAACGGVPQKIIELAEKIISGKLTGKEPSWLKTRLPAILLMLFLLMAAGGLAAYLYPIFINPVKPPVEVKEAVEPKSTLSNKEVVTSVVSKDVTAKQAVESVMVEELAGHWNKERSTDIEGNPLKVGVNDTTQVLVSKGNRLDLQDVTEIGKETSVEGSKEQRVEELNASELQTAAEALQVDRIKEGKDQPKTESSAPTNEEAVLDHEAAIFSAKESEQQTAEKEPDSIFTMASELLSVPPSHYTLQLLAVATEESLQQFISEYGLPTADLRIYQTRRNNKPLYVVIFGEYASRSAVEKASKNLPGSLANMSSWIKKYQLVHQDLQLNNE